MTSEQVWLYLLIVPPGMSIIAALLALWATKRSAKRLDERIKNHART